MPTTIQTKDGIVIRGIPDGTPDDVIKARVLHERAIRAQESAPAEPANADPSATLAMRAGLEALNSGKIKPAQLESFQRNFVEQAQAERQRVRGQIPSAVGARGKMSFSFSPKERLAIAKRALDEHFGAPVDVSLRNDEVEFVHPETGEKLPFNPPGFDAGDVSGFMGQVPPLAGEAAGILAGLSSGVPGGAAVGAAAGHQFGTLASYGAGRAMGVNQDVPALKVLGESGPSALLSGLGAQALPMLSAAGRAARGVPSAKVPDMVGDLQRPMEDIAPVIAQIEAATGKTIRPTTGQLSGKDDVLAIEQDIAGGDKGAVLRQQIKDNQGIVEDYRKVISAPFDAPQDTLATGLSLRRKLISGPGAAAAKVQADTKAAQSAASNSIALKSMPAQDAAALSREALEQGKKAVDDAFETRYKELDAAGGMEVSTPTTRAVGRRWASIIDSDVIPLLSQEDAPIFKQAASVGTKVVPGRPASAIVDASGAPLVQGTEARIVDAPVKLSSVQRTLSSIRDEIRAISKGVSPRKEVVALRDLERALLADRDAALAKNPALREKVMALETDYATAKTDIDRGMIGIMLDRKEGGGFKLRDDLVIPRLLNSPTSARSLSTAIANPKYGTFGEASQRIKEGMLGEYERKVIQPDTGIANIAAHDAFMKNHSSSLEAFFSPREMQLMRRPGEAAKMLKAMQEREAKALKIINESFQMRLAHYDASAIVDAAVQPGKLEATAKLRRALAGSPDLWRGVQAQVSKRNWQKVMPWNEKSGTFDINNAALKAVINGPEAQMLEATLGKQYVDGMRTISRILETLDRAPAVKTQGAGAVFDTFGPMTPLRAVVRVVAEPFSAKSRAATAGFVIRRKMAERALAQAFSNPADMIRLQQLHGASRNEARRILGAFGADLLVDPVDVEQRPDTPSAGAK